MPPVIEVSRHQNPFDTTGVSRDSNGVPRYDTVPATLLEMLAEQVERHPDNEAVVEIGAGRLTYRQLWDRAARVAGGLRAAGLRPGDRVAVRHPAGRSPPRGSRTSSELHPSGGTRQLGGQRQEPISVTAGLLVGCNNVGGGAKSRCWHRIPHSQVW